MWHQISAPQRSAALWGGEREEQEGGGVQDTRWGQRGRALAASKPATAQSRSPKPQPKPQPKAATKPVAAQSRSPKPALEPQTRRQTGKQAGRQGLGKGLGKGAGWQGQGAAPRARPRGSAKKGKSFPGRKVVPASRSPDRAQKWGEGRRYSPRSGSNRSEAREPRRRLDGGPSSSSHFLKIASPAVVCGCYAVAAPAAMTADTRPVPGLGAQATR